MRLTVIGCAAAWGRGPDAASSCYLVEEGDTAVVLDLGQGAFARLAMERAPASLAAVLVSHAHADHCVDLIPLRHSSEGMTGRIDSAQVRLNFNNFSDEEFAVVPADNQFSEEIPGDLNGGAKVKRTRKLLQNQQSE